MKDEKGREMTYWGGISSPVQVNVLVEDTRRATALIDGATGFVIEDAANSCDHLQQTIVAGFGTTRKLLEVEPFRLAPWLTPAVCEQELDIERGKRQ